MSIATLVVVCRIENVASNRWLGSRTIGYKLCGGVGDYFMMKDIVYRKCIEDNGIILSL